MKSLFTRRAVVILSLLTVLGCGQGERTVQLKGKLSSGGKEVKLAEGENMIVHVSFKGRDGEETTVSGDVQADGSFLA